MPSVGSTPTTSSPAQQQQQQPQSNQTRYFTTSAQTVATTPSPSSMQHMKLQQQHSLPLQLQYQVTTTQPSSAGIFISQTAGIISSTTTLGNYFGRRATNTSSNSFNTNGGDISPASSSGSFSSADTNKTMLNAIVNHQNNQQRPHTNKSSATLSRNGTNNNNSSLPMARGGGRHTTSQSRAYRTKYSQFMIITPAVSIDRNFKRTTIITTHQNNSAENHAFNAAADDDYDDDDDDDAHFSNNNGNMYRASMRQSSIDSGNSSDSVGSFRSNYNPYLHTSRQHLLPKSSPAFCVFSPSSWGWCTFLCAAMRCFGSGGNSGGAHNSRSHYSSSFVRPLYQRSRSSGVHTNVTPSKAPHRRLRSYSTASFTPETAFEHFSAPFKHRKARDPLNNITYEL